MRKGASTGLKERRNWSGGWRLAGTLGLLALAVGYGQPEAKAATIKEPGGPKAGVTFDQQWKQLIQAAQAEGRLVITGAGAVQDHFAKVREAFERKFGIKITYSLGRGAQETERMLAERRAGRYTVDIGHHSAGNAIERLQPAGLLDPIPPLLIHPEVTNRSLWLNGKHHYEGVFQQYHFMHSGSLSFSDLVPNYYNTKLVSKEEIRAIKSPHDLLTDRWKGKMGSLIGDTALWHDIYRLGDKGKEWLRTYFLKMDVFFTADMARLVDRLALGEIHAILPTGGGLGAEVRKVKALGLPVNPIEELVLQEGWPIPSRSISTGAGRSGIHVINRRPHPNAAQLYLNWFLSREGQGIINSTGTDNGSFRVDIPRSTHPQAQFDPRTRYHVQNTNPNELAMMAEADKFVLELYKLRQSR